MSADDLLAGPLDAAPLAGGPMTHIRFTADTIDRIKPHADTDGKTVSTWVRDLVAAELDRREQERP